MIILVSIIIIQYVCLCVDHVVAADAVVPSMKKKKTTEKKKFFECSFCEGTISLDERVICGLCKSETCKSCNSIFTHVCCGSSHEDEDEKELLIHCRSERKSTKGELRLDTPSIVFIDAKKENPY